MAAGSYIRFVIGLLLSISVVISFFTKEITSGLSTLLAFIFIILAVLWVAFKF